jgi:hypothetical protein
MSYPFPVTRPRKGQMKCFRCREACPSKDGDWHDHQQRQVFLCKTCAQQPVGSPKGESVLIK